MKRFIWRKKRCPRCKGERNIYETDGRLCPCPDCRGTGEVEE